ncbi:MAG: glycosyltransferase family 4 protein [Bdellovibrionaceae bacterium]|nr:glycosyltransferase family 4 protein [Pseudobdellovibrionaceae bacterium]
MTLGYRKMALRFGIMDIPNERSAHIEPIPRGAGIAFFFAFNVVLGILVFQNALTMKYTYPVFLGGPVVMLLGYWDDVSSLSAWIRLFVHFLVSLFILVLISAGFSKGIDVSFLPSIPWLTAAFTVFYIAWFINLYNFMDGCDGLATTVGMVGAGLIAILSFVSGNTDLAIIYVVLAYALAGFLIFNWFPAKVFMGDAGAYYLGYVFGALALVSKLYYDSSLFVHLIIFGTFIVDATWTLIRRFLRGVRVFQAHREHAFQKLMVQGWGASRVTALYVLITVLWLFPMASFAMSNLKYSFWFLVVAYLPLWGFVIWMKAGTPNNLILKEENARLHH